jgi:hypothetical protein
MWLRFVGGGFLIIIIVLLVRAVLEGKGRIRF